MRFHRRNSLLSKACSASVKGSGARLQELPSSKLRLNEGVSYCASFLSSKTLQSNGHCPCSGDDDINAGTGNDFFALTKLLHVSSTFKDVRVPRLAEAGDVDDTKV